MTNYFYFFAVSDGPSLASEKPQTNSDENNNTPEAKSVPAIVPSSQPPKPDETEKQPTGKSETPTVTKRNDTTTATVGNSRNGAQGIVSCLNMSVVTLLIVATVHL